MLNLLVCNPKAVQVATRCTIQNAEFTNSALTGNSRFRHPVAVDCRAPRLVYRNPSAQAITVRAGLELSSVVTQVTWNGSPVVTIAAGAIATSDPLPLTLLAGNTVWSRTYVTIASGSWSADQITDTNTSVGGSTEGSESGAALADKSLSGTISGYARGYGPSGLLGQTLSGAIPPGVAVFGDSIAEGFTDNATGGLADYAGWPFRAFSSGARPSIKVGRGGDTTPVNASRFDFISACPVQHIICALGCNDVSAFQASGGLASMKTAFLTAWATLASRGHRVWQTTVLPRTTSSDSWSTTGNQTPVSGYGSASLRVDFNNWLRDGVGLTNLSGIIEMADAVESARDSGLWAVAGGAYTSDGIHPNGRGHTAMVNAITTSIFS